MSFTKIAAAGIGSTELVTLHSLDVLNDVTINGVLTYEDVTNVDSIGLITARNGIVVGSGITLSKDGDGFFTGVTTTGSLVSSGAISGTTGTFSDNVSIVEKIIHTGDTDTFISFPENDAIRLETGGVVRLILDSGNVVQQSGTFIVKNATGDSTGLKLSQESGDESRIFNHFSGPLTFGTSNDEKVRIDSSGRVLIGTTTEGQADADNLTIADSGSCGITLRSGTSAAGAIYFSDATSGAAEYDGAVLYNQSSRFMDFYTAQSARLRITSDGDVGIGIDSPAAKFSIHESSSSSASSQLMRITTANGGLFGIETDETVSNPTWKIGGVVNSGAAEPLAFYQVGSEVLRITSDKVQFNVDAKVDSDNARDLGASGARWKDLYLGGSLFLGGTGSTNALDDYEEGNYVPTIGDDNGNNHTIDGSYNNLAYEKIGSFVSVHGRIRLSAKNNSASGTYVRLSLPFTSSSSPPEDAGRVSGSVVIQNSSADINSYATHPTHDGNSYIQIGLSNDTAFSGDVHTKFSGNELIAVQIMYRAA